MVTTPHDRSRPGVSGSSATTPAKRAGSEARTAASATARHCAHTSSARVTPSERYMSSARRTTSAASSGRAGRTAPTDAAPVDAATARRRRCRWRCRRSAARDPAHAGHAGVDAFAPVAVSVPVAELDAHGHGLGQELFAAITGAGLRCDALVLASGAARDHHRPLALADAGHAAHLMAQVVRERAGGEGYDD